MNIIDLYPQTHSFVFYQERTFDSIMTYINFHPFASFYENLFIFLKRESMHEFQDNKNRIPLIIRTIFYGYTSILLIDSQKGEIIQFPLRRVPNFVSTTETGPWFYYGIFRINNNIKNLHIYCFDCLTGEDRTAIVIEGTCTFGVLDTLLVGLDDRHALIFDSSPGPRLGWFFQTRLLVDFDDGRTYPVPEDLDGDSLARLQDVWLCGPGSDTLILKTGRIQWQEKENFWCQNDTVYTDQMETIAFCRTGDLIRSIKAGRAIPWTIVDRSDRSSALNVLESDHQYLYYWKKDFRSGVTLLTHFPLGRSAKPDDLQRYPFAEREWGWTWFRNGEGYGVRHTDDGTTELVRLRDRQPLFRTRKGTFVHVDPKNEHVLMARSPESQKDRRGCRLILVRLPDGMVLDQWEDRHFFYDDRHDRIVLY